MAFGYGYSQAPLEKAKAEYEKKSTEQLANYDLFAERLTELKAELEAQLKEEAQLNEIIADNFLKIKVWVHKIYAGNNALAIT